MNETEHVEGERVETVGDTIRNAIAASRDTESSQSGSAEEKPAPHDEAPAWLKGAETWRQLPETVRAEIRRRDENVTKGLGALREKHRDFDNAITPYEPVLRQAGRTPAQEAKQLLGWHMQLAGPGKVAAFKQLAQNLGVDVSQFAGHRREGGLPPEVRPVVHAFQARLEGVERSYEERRHQEATATVEAWAKHKPHFQRVRELMGSLVQAEIEILKSGGRPVGRFLTADGLIDMDRAYEAAIYAHPEVRAEALAADQQKRERELKASAERARRSGASVRSGAPVSGRGTAGEKAPPRNESARESIRRALQEVRG